MRERKEEEYTKVICSMNVATGEGTFFPKFSLMYVESKDEWYAVQHKKGVIPSPDSLKQGLMISFINFSSHILENETARIIENAMRLHDHHGGYHICPFTFLVTYCLSKGLDLFAEDILAI